MRRVLYLSVTVFLLSLAGCAGAESSDEIGATEAAEPPRLPVYGPSVVFGPEGAPTGGDVVIGLLVETAPSERLVDLIAPELWAAYCVTEGTRAAVEANGGTYSESDDLLEEIEEDEIVEPWKWVDNPPKTGGSSPWARSLEEAMLEVRTQTNVRVRFRNVLASECEGLAAVFADGSPRYPADRAHLERYLESGGPIYLNAPADASTSDVGLFRPGLLPGPTEGVDGLVAVCLEVIGTSPFVHRLERDPLALRSAKRRGDEVVVRLADAPSEAVLRDLDDRRVAKATVASDGTVSVTAPDRGDRPYRERLVATWTDGEVVLRRAWSVVDLVGTVERRVFASKVLDAGAAFAPRVLFLNSRTGAPVAGREETLALHRGEQVLVEAAGASDEMGSLDARLRVPSDVEPGAATLVVGTDEFPVTIRSPVRVSVVTDRALYRPTDEVHVRVMVHDANSGHPAADRSVLLKLQDVKKTVTTSAHGIASATFRLVEAKLGWKHVKAEIGGVEGSSRFRIRAFERPTFTVELDPEALTLRPGETAPFRLIARYVNGSPLLGAEVSFYVPRSRDIHLETGATGRTDPRGVYEGVVRLGPDATSGALTLWVIDADGRCFETRIPVEVPDESRTLSVERLEDVIAHRPCRLEVRASTPGPVDVSIGDDRVATVEVDESGVAELVITPPALQFQVRLTAEGARAVARNLTPFEPGDGLPLVIPARRTARVGETLEVTIEALDGPVWLDVMRHGAQIRGLSARALDGVARLALVLDEDLAGVLELRAWHLASGEPRGTSVRVLVTRDRALRVEATPRQGRYRPAETAVVDVSVRTRDGEPTAAVLGYWGVDEALLALAPLPDGHEEIFDVLPARSTAHHRSLARQTEDGDAARFAFASRVLGRHEAVSFPTGSFYVHQNAPVFEDALETARQAELETWVAELRKAYLEAFEAVPVEALRTATSWREAVAFVVASGRLSPDRLRDPWGTPLDLGREAEKWGERGIARGWSRWWHRYGVYVGSAGPDLVWGTDDDVVDLWSPPDWREFSGPVGRFLRLLAESDPRALGRAFDAPFWGPANNSLIGLGGGAGGAFGGRGGSRDFGGGGGGKRSGNPVHVRRDFDPTLCFVPEAIVGPDGKASLEIPLKDSITTWRLRLVASAADGATGVGQTRVRVSQPLHVDPWIAPHLTVGDQLELPVSVRNETDDVLDVALSLSLSGHLEAIGVASALVSVPPGGTGAHRFCYRALARGSARIRVDADAGAHRDAIERIVSVTPNAREVVDVANGSVSSKAPWQAELPALAAGVPHEHRVSVYPSPLAETLDGFEGLIACPHG